MLEYYVPGYVGHRGKTPLKEKRKIPKSTFDSSMAGGMGSLRGGVEPSQKWKSLGLTATGGTEDEMFYTAPQSPLKTKYDSSIGHGCARVHTRIYACTHARAHTHTQCFEEEQVKRGCGVSKDSEVGFECEIQINVCGNL